MRCSTSPLILLSFDVEEFDTPLEYGQELPEADQIRVTAEGLDLVTDLLERLGVRATFFTTARYALHRPEQIRHLAARHEVASHGFTHGQFSEQDPRRSKAVLEEIIDTELRGFRRPRMGGTLTHLLGEAGYRYDSSTNPTWIPGRYCDVFETRTAHLRGGVLVIPASVTPLVRLPLFWLSFKNLPLSLIQRASSRVLEANGYLSLYYHPWEFVDLTSFRLPGYIRRMDGRALLVRLEQYLRWLGCRGQLVTFGEFDARFRRAAEGH